MEMNVNQQLWMVKAVLIAQILTRRVFEAVTEDLWGIKSGMTYSCAFSLSILYFFFLGQAFFLQIKATERPSYNLISILKCAFKQKISYNV